MDDWKKDKLWSDVFIPEIKQILGTHLIAPAPFDEDAERNTDLIVLKLEAVRIACRIRKNKYLASYGNQFTIRSGRPSGAKTELTKIIEGWGDYFFYGFAAANERHLERWILGRLGALRLYINRQLALNRRGWEQQKNIDGSSDFVCFEYEKIPEFIVATGPQQMALFGEAV